MGTEDYSRRVGHPAANIGALPRDRRNREAAFAPALAITVVLALAGFASLMSVVVLLVDPKPIPGIDLAQRQDAETALYLAAFGILLPLALLAGPRLSRATASGPNGAALSSIAALLCASFATTIVVVRISDTLIAGGSAGLLLGAMALWWAAAGALMRAAVRAPWRSRQLVANNETALWVVAGICVLGAVLSVTSLQALDPLGLALAVPAAAAIAWLARRWSVPRLSRRWGAAADAVIAVTVLLAVPDLVFIELEDPTGMDRFVNGVIQFHHNFLLGPANQVLGGGAMLVDTSSQYGVGSIYFLTGWFTIAPIGYGAFALLDGLLTGAFFVAGYALLRVAGVPRVLAAGSLAVALVALVLHGLYPIGGLPQEGPLRFGLPMAAVLAAAAGARWPAWSRWTRVAGLAVLALASVWALEAFGYTALTLAALACFDAYLLPAGERLRWLARQAALAAVACACAHALLAGATLAGSGELPHWGQYLAFLDAFFRGTLRDVTYDFRAWSPGIAVGAVYTASTAALILLARTRQALFRHEHVVLLALTGTTAYGIALFSYFVNRSADHVLPYMSLPAVLVAVLWLSLLLRTRGREGRAGAGALAFALSLAALLVAGGWSSAGPRLERSALAHLVPGGASPTGAIDRLLHLPPIDSRAGAGARLLERYMPGEDRTVVLVKPDRDTEILMRSGRANRLPIANPVEDGFVADVRKPGLRDAVADLRPGDRLLLDQGMLDALAAVRADPASELLTALIPGTATAPLQLFALMLVEDRFRLHTIHRSRAELVVVRLERRR